LEHSVFKIKYIAGVVKSNVRGVNFPLTLVVEVKDVGVLPVGEGLVVGVEGEVSDLVVLSDLMLEGVNHALNGRVVVNGYLGAGLGGLDAIGEVVLDNPG
jgi:hypothetical protein